MLSAFLALKGQDDVGEKSQHRSGAEQLSTSPPTVQPPHQNSPPLNGNSASALQSSISREGSKN